ncbi:MAG: hypothetical protein ACAI25_18915 [Planctomycetota bacterium]
MSTTPRDELGTLIANILAGLKTSVPKELKSIMVGNEVVSVQTLTKVVQEHDDLWQKAEDLGAEFHAAVQARDANVPSVRDYMTDVKLAIIAALGGRNPELLKFGIQPRKDRRKLTGEERARANAKRRATEGVKHLLGPSAGVEPTSAAEPKPADESGPEKRTA